MTLPQIMMTGNLIADPELRFTGSGVAVASFTVACTKRKKDGEKWVDAGTTFLRCSAWRQLAENVAESVTKGMQVTVTGDLSQRDWEDREGNKRTSFDVEARTVAVELSRLTVKAQKVEREAPTGRTTIVDDPWAATKAVDNDPPF